MRLRRQLKILLDQTWAVRYYLLSFAVVLAIVVSGVFITTRTLVRVPENADTIRRVERVQRETLVLVCQQLINEKVLAPIASILETARTGSERNPLPTDLPESQRKLLEAQREQARQFYETQIKAVAPVDCMAYIAGILAAGHASGN